MEASGPPPPLSIQILSFETVGQPELYSDHQSKNLNLIYSAVWAKIHIFWHPQLVAIFGDKNIDINNKKAKRKATTWGFPIFQISPSSGDLMNWKVVTIQNLFAFD